jgi:uncharacterized coiled-coil protein SlyX
MKYKLLNLTLAAVCSLPFAGFAQGTYLSDPNDTNNHALVVEPGGNIGIGTTTPVVPLDVAGKARFHTLSMIGNDNSGVRYDAWPVSSLGIRRSDYDLNRVTVASFGFRNDPAYLTDDSVANIRLYDPEQVPNAATSSSTTQLRIASPGPLVLQPSSGNVGIGTDNPQSKLDVAGKVNCTVLELTSDRAQKSGFAPVDCGAMLAQVARLPLSTWHYTNETGVTHIGPMAQDFQAAFRVGSDDKHIATVDADGVLFAAVQGLHQLVQEKDARIAALETKLAQQERSLATCLAAVEKLTAQSGSSSKTVLAASLSAIESSLPSQNLNQENP